MIWNLLNRVHCLYIIILYNIWDVMSKETTVAARQAMFKQHAADYIMYQFTQFFWPSYLWSLQASLAFELMKILYLSKNMFRFYFNITIYKTFYQKYQCLKKIVLFNQRFFMIFITQIQKSWSFLIWCN